MFPDDPPCVIPRENAAGKTCPLTCFNFQGCSERRRRYIALGIDPRQVTPADREVEATARGFCQHVLKRQKN